LTEHAAQILSSTSVDSQVDSQAAALQPDRIVGLVPPWSLYSRRRRYGFLAILFGVTTSSYFDYYVLSVVLEPIKQEFGVSDTMLGLLGGFSFALLYSISALPIAQWADRGNRRTIITVTLVVWSVMTAACGFARSFWELALARVGVGMAEPGAVPPAQSLIADYFPPGRRASASSILNAGSAAGYLVGVGIGGYIAATFGWRAVFLLAGAPGLVLAIIVRTMLPEPRSQLGFPSVLAPTKSRRQSLARLRHKQTFVFTLIGASIFTVFSFAAGLFLPSFMIRDLHASLMQVSATWAITISAASLLGAVLGGWLADLLSKRDIRWHAWLSAVTCALGAPLYLMALAASSVSSFIALDFLAELVLAVGISVSFAPVHAVCGGARRTQAIAVMQLAFMLVGAGCGPLMAGALSDLLSTFYGAESLRYSLMAMVLFLIPAAAAFYCAGRAMPRELED